MAPLLRRTMAFHTPRAIVAVTNDLVTDNRVDRTCRVLQERCNWSDVN